MKKYILFAIYLFLCIPFLYAQKEIPKAIVNSKSNQHQNILNSKVFLVFPEGFKNSYNFIGITNGNEGIQVFDLVGGSYYTNSRNFTSENFQKRGLEVSEFIELTVNGYPARFISIKANGNIMHSDDLWRFYL